MEDQQLKTSWKVRIIMFVIAILLLGSTVAIYALVVLTPEQADGVTASEQMSAEDKLKLSQLQTKLEEYQETLEEERSALSDKYLETLKGYRSQVKSYNATTANNSGLQTTDLKEGSGATLSSDSTDYYAYYIGWCADESVFDSSFDDFDNPTALSHPIQGGNLIEGWNQGIDGMKVGGVRQITIPGELAYGDSQEICGGTNSPLKFVVMPIDASKYAATYSEALRVYNELMAMYQ